MIREIDKLRGLDLHHLRALVSLVELRSVTQAAQALDISQSAMSNLLARLRRQLADPLLVQTSREMVPTQRAMTIADAARRSLAMLAEVIENEDEFTPAKATQNIVICTSDYVGALLLPALMRRLGELAPSLSVSVRVAEPTRAGQMLDDGSCDCVVSYFQELPGELYVTELLRDRLYVLARAAIATGVDGIFIETHIDPSKALSDGPNQIPLSDLPALLNQLLRLHAIAHESV